MPRMSSGTVNKKRKTMRIVCRKVNLRNRNMVSVAYVQLRKFGQANDSIEIDSFRSLPSCKP